MVDCTAVTSADPEYNAPVSNVNPHPVSIWWVPVPSFVVKMLVRLASSQVYGVTPSEPIETGLPIAAVLSGLVYIVALVRGLTLLRALGLAAVGGLIGLLLQVSLVVAGL